MKELNRWLHAHPIKAVLFAVFFATLAGVCTIRDDWPLKVGIPGAVVGLIIWAINWRRDARKLTALFLAAVLASVPVASGHAAELGPVFAGQDQIDWAAGLPEPPPDGELHAEAGGCLIGGAILIGGGLAVYLIIKLCKRVFPAPPAPPAPGTNGIPGLVAAGEFAPDTDAACYLDAPLYAGSCFSECGESDGALNAAAMDDRAWTVVQVDIAIGESEFGPTARVQATRPSSAATKTTDLDGFKRGLSRWGLRFDETQRGAAWAKNSRPIPAGASPIQLNLNVSGTVPIVRRGSGKVYPARIERSFSPLGPWEFLCVAQVQTAQVIRIIDTTNAKQGFYRVNIGGN